ncbi:MAG: hypothetical protein V1748_13150 [Actinomycetota bacterium]
MGSESSNLQLLVLLLMAITYLGAIVIVHEFGHMLGLRWLGFAPTSVCLLCEMDWTTEQAIGKYRTMKWRPLGYEVRVGSYVSWYAGFVDDLQYRSELESMSRPRQVLYALSGHIASLALLIGLLLPGAAVWIATGYRYELLLDFGLITLLFYVVGMLVEPFMAPTDLGRVRTILTGQGMFAYHDQIIRRKTEPIRPPRNRFDALWQREWVRTKDKWRAIVAQDPERSRRRTLYWALAAGSLFALGLISRGVYFLVLRNARLTLVLDGGRAASLANLLSQISVDLWIIAAMISLFVIIRSGLELRRDRRHGSTLRRLTLTALSASLLVGAAIIAVPVWERTGDRSLGWVFPSGAAQIEGKRYVWERRYDEPGRISSFNDITGVDEEHIWAVGYTTDEDVFPAVSFNGFEWEECRLETGFGDDLTDVFALGPDDVWTTSRNGELVHLDGDRWKKQTRKGIPPGYEDGFSGVYALSSYEVLVAGEVRYLFSFNGTSWKTERDLVGEDHNGMNPGGGGTVLVPSDTWDVKTGTNQYLLTDKTGTWSEEPKPDAGLPLETSALSSENVWGAAINAIVHWDGTVWSKELEKDGLAFLDVFAVTEDDVWALAVPHSLDTWRLYHFDGKRWDLECEAPPVNAPKARNSMSSIYATDSKTVWLAGDGIYRGTRKNR